MEDSKVVVCRLCLSLTTFDECQTLDTVSRDMLKFIIPDIDLDISHDPKICQACYKTVLRCYRFKSNCNKKDAKTEDDIKGANAISIHVEDVEKKCDFCSNNRGDENVEEFNDRKTYFTEVLQKCLPEWNLGTKTIPCKKCLDILTSQFTFIGNCVDTEDKLKHYCLTHGTNSKGKLNLYEVVQYVLSKESEDLDQDVSCVGVPQVNNEVSLPEVHVDTEFIKMEEVDVPFPEVNVNTESLKMEEVDIKMEGVDEEHVEFEEGPGSSRSGKQLKVTKLKIKTNESLPSVKRYCAGIARKNIVPPKKPRKDEALVENSLENDKYHIRRIVHSFYMKLEQPTLETIQSALIRHGRTPLSKVILTRVLKEINFRTMGRRCGRFLKERDETIISRRHYLTQIKAYRKANAPIYYTDEMHIYVGKEPYGTSFTFLHIGNKDGFVEDGLLLLQTKKTEDCTKKFKQTAFEKWFPKILPKLKDNAVIVLHNSACTSRRLDEHPTSTTHKVDVQKWLLAKGIAFEEDMVKLELLDLVRKAKSPVKQYAVDEIAKANNKTVLRYPPYHNELSPLQTIWPKVKSEYMGKNFVGTPGFGEVEACLADAVSHVSEGDWTHAMKEVLRLERNMWQLDIDMERVMEPFLTTFGCSGSESDSE